RNVLRSATPAKAGRRGTRDPNPGTGLPTHADEDAPGAGPLGSRPPGLGDWNTRGQGRVGNWGVVVGARASSVGGLRRPGGTGGGEASPPDAGAGLVPGAGAGVIPGIWSGLGAGAGLVLGAGAGVVSAGGVVSGAGVPGLTSVYPLSAYGSEPDG